MKKVLIAIPTYRRPEGLKRLLDSLVEMDRPKGIVIDVLVVENDQQKTVSSIVSAFEKKSKIKTHYVLEKHKGLAYVRNRILKEATALKVDYLAGLDDDEFVSKGWLTALWQGLKAHKATVVTGPTLSVFDQMPPKWIIRGKFFAMGSTRSTGTAMKRCATGNFLLDFAFICKHNLSFDMRFNFIGGEDIDFFNAMVEKGARVVWVNEALVSESVPVSRMCLSYFLKRAMRIANGRMTLVYKNSGLFSWLALGLVGLLKSFVYSIGLPLMLLKGKAGFYKGLVKAVRQLSLFLSFFRIQSNVYR